MLNETEILNIFARNVRYLRKMKGWSQEELGRQSTLHRTYIGSIERGTRNVSLVNIYRIATALGVQVSVLISSNL